jgi:hypothetical protein
MRPASAESLIVTYYLYERLFFCPYRATYVQFALILCTFSHRANREDNFRYSECVLTVRFIRDNVTNVLYSKYMKCLCHSLLEARAFFKR